TRPRLCVCYGRGVPHRAHSRLGAQQQDTGGSALSARRLPRRHQRSSSREGQAGPAVLVPDPPNIQKVLFDTPRENGLIPPLKRFKSWEENFLTRVPQSQGRHLAKLKYWIQRSWRRWTKRVS